MAAQAAKMLSQEELEKIVVELNLAMQMNNGLAIGQQKGAYQMFSKDRRLDVRNYYPSTFILFGVKQEDAKQSIVDVLKGIQIHHKKLLKK